MARITARDIGLSAVRTWQSGSANRGQLAIATRYTLELLEQNAPGHSVEVRIPPFAAVQVIDGPRHTRGTPPNVIETDADTWLALATGTLNWDDAVAAARVAASGDRCNHIATFLPLVTPDSQA